MSAPLRKLHFAQNWEAPNFHSFSKKPFRTATSSCRTPSPRTFRCWSTWRSRSWSGSRWLCCQLHFPPGSCRFWTLCATGSHWRWRRRTCRRLRVPPGRTGDRSWLQEFHKPGMKIYVGDPNTRPAQYFSRCNKSSSILECHQKTGPFNKVFEWSDLSCDLNFVSRDPEYPSTTK